MNAEINALPRHNSKLIIALFLIGMFLTAAFAGAFLPALMGNLHPEIAGFPVRWWQFTWRYALPAGIVPVVVFVVVYRKHL